jgi:hypothetical protein
MERFTFGLSILIAIVCAFALDTVATKAAAFNLTFSETCYGDKADVTFRWQGPNAASQQWIDLSLFNNGWRDGTFIGVGPLAGSVTSYTWTGIVANTPHVLRINQLASVHWDASHTFSFTACAQPVVEQGSCHPSYVGGVDVATGGCIRANVGDYDCAGGSGNGPNYARGPVRVVGPDVFALDGDRDGTACER